MLYIHVKLSIDLLAYICLSGGGTLDDKSLACRLERLGQIAIHLRLRRPPQDGSSFLLFFLHFVFFNSLVFSGTSVLSSSIFLKTGVLVLLKSQNSTPSSYEGSASMLPSSIYRRSTAQRNQPCTKQRSTHVPVRVRQRKQADRLGESKHIVEHLQRVVFSNPAKKIDIRRGKKNRRPQEAGDDA